MVVSLQFTRGSPTFPKAIIPPKVKAGMDLSLKLQRIDQIKTSAILEHEDLPSQKPPSYHSLSAPPWNAYALGYQATTPVIEDGCQTIENKENFNCNKGIATQLAPEEFSLDDVRHLQKLIRELHAENIQKTLSYIKLEKAYYCQKDEIADLKRPIAKHKEDSEGQVEASSNMRFDEAGKEELSKESGEFKKIYDGMELEEANPSELNNVGEERFECFRSIVNNNNVILTENKKLLDAMMQKIQVLESELAVWKERNSEWEKLHKEESSLDARRQMEVDIPQRPSIIKSRHLDNSIILDEDGSSRSGRQDDRKSNTFIYKYVVPKANSCFSCLKAVLCRCPKAPLQVDSRRTGCLDPRI